MGNRLNIKALSFVVLAELLTLLEVEHSTFSNSVDLLLENLGITGHLREITVVGSLVGLKLRVQLMDRVVVEVLVVQVHILQIAHSLQGHSARTNQLGQLLGVNSGVSIAHRHMLDLVQVLKLNTVVGE